MTVSRVKERIHDLFRNPDSSHRCWLKPEVEEKIFNLAFKRSDLTQSSRSDVETSNRKDNIDLIMFETRLLEELDTAFQVNPIMSAFDLFNPDLLPPRNEDEFTNYVLNEIQTLLDFYSKLRSDTFMQSTNFQDAIIKHPDKDELEFFKDSLADGKRQHENWLTEELSRMRLTSPEKEAQDFLEKNRTIPLMKLYRHLKQDDAEHSFPNILRLFKLALIIPTSTAEVERCFSCLNLLCTDLRSKLSQQNLEHLMRINLLQLSKELTEPDWKKIIDVFNRKPRRMALTRI